MITNKIVGIAILMACVLLPIIVILISAIIEAIKDIIIFGDWSGLFILFWSIAVIVGFGLVIF